MGIGSFLKKAARGVTAVATFGQSEAIIRAKQAADKAAREKSDAAQAANNNEATSTLDNALNKGMEKGRALAADRFSAGNLEAARQTATSPEMAALLKRQEAAANSTPQEVQDIIARRQANLETSPEMAAILKRREAGLEGLNAEENRALREQGTQELRQTTQGNLRSLRGMQASAGVRGGAAGAQLGGVLAAGNRNQANMERDLLIKNVEMKRNALGDYEGSVGQRDAAKRAALGDYEGSVANRENLRLSNDNALSGTIQNRDEAGRQLVLNKLTTELGLGQGEMGAASSLLAANKEVAGRKKIICTILHEQGFMSDYVYAHDAAYGFTIDQDLYNGYYVWAKHLAAAMERFPLLSKLVNPIVKPWSEHMVFLMGGCMNDNTFGRILATIGSPLCRFIGRNLR